MSLSVLALALSLLDQSAPRSAAAADAVTLKGGTVVFGEIAEAAPRGGTVLLVRRGWAARHAPALLTRWDAAQRPEQRRAVAQRLARLKAWKADRAASAAPGPDRIAAWIDAETKRLVEPDALTSSRLMRVTLARGDVVATRRAARGDRGLLRLAWEADLPDPEGMALPALKTALEGRGFQVADPPETNLDALLPLAAESDRQWLLRRAATEVANDPGLRFLNYSGLVMPEPAPGQAVDPNSAVASLSAGVRQLLNAGQEDGLAPHLARVGESGRVGAVVTRLDVDEDFASATAEIALQVRSESGRWVAAGSRVAKVRTDEVGDEAAKGLAQDPQIGAVFKLAEGLGLGKIDGAVKARSLNVGEAARLALGRARALAERDLTALAFPLR